MRSSKSSPSTPEPSGRRFAGRGVGLVVGVVILVAGCTSDTSPTTSDGAPDADHTATTATVTSTSPPSPETTIPPQARGRAVAVVAPCEATDEAVVAAPVAPIGGVMAVDGDRVWISSLAAGGLVPVEADTLCPGDVVAVESAPFGVSAMAFGPDGTLYVAAARSGAISSISPGPGEVTPWAPGIDGSGGIAVSGDRLWAVCCDTDAGDGGGRVVDVTTGETVASVPIGPAVDVDAVGDTAWIGRRDVAGMYRARISGDEVAVDEIEAFGSTTVALTASADGAWIVSDEPVLQRYVDGTVEEATVLPFPRERQVDIDVDPFGGVWAVTSFGPGIVWLRPDGVAFNALGAENLVQVEATGDRVWALTTDGALIRVDRSVLGE